MISGRKEREFLKPIVNGVRVLFGDDIDEA
jgi:hypothetical protein